MIFTLHGGSYATDSATASSYEFCKINGNLLVQREISKGIILGGKKIKIESGKFICLSWDVG